MTPRSGSSIQRRLLARLLGGTLLVWLAASLATWRDVRHELDELLDAHLAQAAALLVVQQAGDIERHGIDDDEPERTIDAPVLDRHATRSAFQVLHEGRIVVRSSDAPHRAFGPPDASGFFEFEDEHARRWRVYATRGEAHDIAVFVGEQLDARAEIVRGALRGALAPMAVAIALFALLAAWAVRRALRPLHALAGELAQRRGDAVDPVALADRPREIAPLVDALDALFARIGAMVQSERRFTADAAHELRTPIAAIRTQAQVALGAGDDGAERAHALRATIAGCDRATRLVEQLLTLSRLDAGAAVARETVDLAALARRVVGELAPHALDRGQALSLEVAAPRTLDGAPTLLGVLLRNLVDNALRYSPDGARIDVQVGDTHDGAVLLRVCDSGPGLDPAVAARLGDRFHRGLGHGQAGSGLGWSIVQRIAQVHALDVTTATAAGLGGLAVTLRRA